MIGGLVVSAVLLPAFVVIERHTKAPMLDLTIFRSRLFSTAAGAAFANGLARFALMFVFVFYFQGVQGDSPILAGIKLAPLAIGMLIASPLAGIWADRRGSRTLAVLGMLVTALGLALMTTLERDTSYFWPCIFMFIVGIGSGMFNSPNTAAMMGSVAPHRRGIAAAARVLVQNTGAVISIAFVLAVVTAAVPKHVLFEVFSGLASHISNRAADAVHRQHAHGAVVSDRGVAGGRGDLRRPSQGRSNGGGGRAPGSRLVSAVAERTVRIGELAELTGTTPRTIRYYEEIGLLGGGAERTQGKHRSYTQADVDRVREIVRLRDLLGLSLEQLSKLLEAESARAGLRREYQRTESAAERKRILESSLQHIGTQLELVRGRVRELTELAAELEDKEKLVKRRIRENSR